MPLLLSFGIMTYFLESFISGTHVRCEVQSSVMHHVMETHVPGAGLIARDKSSFAYDNVYDMLKLTFDNGNIRLDCRKNGVKRGGGAGKGSINVWWSAPFALGWLSDSHYGGCPTNSCMAVMDSISSYHTSLGTVIKGRLSTFYPVKPPPSWFPINPVLCCGDLHCVVQHRDTGEKHFAAGGKRKPHCPQPYIIQI